MRYHRHAASLGLTLMLALQMNIMRGQHEPVVVGESENGTRYYIEAWPPLMRRNTEGMRRHTVDGIACAFMRPYLSRNHAKDKREWQKGWQWWVYTVDDVKGSKQYLKPQRREPLQTDPFTGSGFAWCRVQTTGLKNVKDLISKDRMYVTENVDKPAPNAMYFGFNEKGLQATVQFDETSQVRKVRVNAESCETFEYTMLGKAIFGFFYSSKPKAQFGMILEPVDPEKFDGSKESFSRARINTIVGWHGKAEEVYEALSLNSFEPLKGARSRISRVFKTVRHAASTFRKSRDGLATKLLSGNASEEG
ncbi:hypothetical protein FOZ63_034172, partial [Perkinsus olseni]